MVNISLGQVLTMAIGHGTGSRPRGDDGSGVRHAKGGTTELNKPGLEAVDVRSPDSAAPSVSTPAALPGHSLAQAWGVGAGISWRRPVLMLAGGLVVSEALTHLLHLDGTALLGAGAVAGGWWWLSRRRTAVVPRLPETLNGWISRCEQLLTQFERLDVDAAPGQTQRRSELARWQNQRSDPAASVALAGLEPPNGSLQPAFGTSLRSRLALSLLWGHPLPRNSQDWCWPEGFQHSDLVIFHLRLPLTAADLRWLEAMPQGQPLWLLVEGASPVDWMGLQADLLSQWPAGSSAQLLPWDGKAVTLVEALHPLNSWLNREGHSLRLATARRGIESLHRRWQAELESLRRRRLQRLLLRTQGLVAAAVVAAPLPSLDLVVLAVANGLMLQEMARLWDCPWTADQLRAAALELGRAALALGVVEWSSQALLGAMRLHGATWLVGGAVEALSAAYLTRVVGHAMADVLALSAGVSEPDLEEIKRKAPLLVAEAAASARLEWAGFLQEGRRWLQAPNPAATLH